MEGMIGMRTTFYRVIRRNTVHNKEHFIMVGDRIMEEWKMNESLDHRLLSENKMESRRLGDRPGTVSNVYVDHSRGICIPP